MRNEGGPVFPGNYLDPEIVEALKYARSIGEEISLRDIRGLSKHSGMSLRDLFAAQCIHGMSPHVSDDDVAEYARWAYRMADAMLTARGGQR